jgi:DNA-binding response OmpR family regulator
MKKRVLVVEDHFMTLENLVATCEECGCEVKMAMDLISAKDIIVEENFDVFVWDFNLPDGNTLEAIKIAREKNPGATMIASSSEADNREMQMVAGCNLSASPYSIYNILEEEVNKL